MKITGGGVLEKPSRVLYEYRHFGEAMAFINEYIPDEDKKKHNISPNDHFYRAGTDTWTVDRDNNSFLLMRVARSPESTPGQTTWAFYWRGHLLDVVLQVLDMGGDPHGGHGWAHYKIVAIRRLTPEIEAQRAQVVQDLRAALIAHKGTGVFSRRTSYEVTLDE